MIIQLCNNVTKSYTLTHLLCVSLPLAKVKYDCSNGEEPAVQQTTTPTSPYYVDVIYWILIPCVFNIHMLLRIMHVKHVCSMWRIGKSATEVVYTGLTLMPWVIIVVLLGPFSLFAKKQRRELGAYSLLCNAQSKSGWLIINLREGFHINCRDLPNECEYLSLVQRLRSTSFFKSYFSKGV